MPKPITGKASVKINAKGKWGINKDMVIPLEFINGHILPAVYTIEGVPLLGKIQLSIIEGTVMGDGPPEEPEIP